MTKSGGLAVFFILSKLLVPLESPGDLLLLFLCVGVILSWSTRRRRTGITIIALVTAVLLLIVLAPVSSWIAAPLENRFPRPHVLPAQIDGIIVLGGAVDPGTTARRGLPTLNSDAERMTEFVRLAKQYPQAKLVFSGGSGILGGDPTRFTEASTARLFFDQQGLDTSRVIFEGQSRNTYENVLFSKAIVKPVVGQTWLLISSAQDMPRSVGIFRKLGWSVTPIPVAYKADNHHSYFLGDNLYQLDRGCHEWLGLLVYYLTGKTDALFPAPSERAGAL
jgi:uncharacterized SAM-binding protein YcdF (DUF218 family)